MKYALAAFIIINVNMIFFGLGGGYALLNIAAWLAVLLFIKYSKKYER